MKTTPSLMPCAMLAVAGLAAMAGAALAQTQQGALAQLYAARPPAGASFVRVAHPHAGTLRVKIADGPEQTLSDGKTASSYAIVKADAPFSIVLDGKVSTMKVAPGSYTTLVAQRQGKDLRLAAIDDTGGSQDALKAELRFYNLAADCAEAGLQIAPSGPSLFAGVAPAAAASRSINPVSAQLQAACAKAVSAPWSLPPLQPGQHYSLFLTGPASAPVLRGQASATDPYKP